MSITISVGGGGREAAAPPSWVEVCFTRANFLKEQQEIRAAFLPALQLYLIFQA